MEAIIRRPDPSSSGGNQLGGASLSQTPWRLLRRALKWILFATLVALLITIIPSVVQGVARGIAAGHGRTLAPLVDLPILTLTSILGLQATLLWGAFRGAKHSGTTDVAAGFGYRRIRRRGLLALLGITLIIWDIAAIGLIAWIMSHGGSVPVIPAQFASLPHTPVTIVLYAVSVALIAPVAEELFFRGWLWEALRKTWSPAATLACTSALWMTVHFIDGTLRALMLIPTAILLGLARRYGDSVRASICLHLMNNGLVVAFQLMALYLASHSGGG